MILTSSIDAFSQFSARVVGSVGGINVVADIKRTLPSITNPTGSIVVELFTYGSVDGTPIGYTRKKKVVSVNDGTPPRIVAVAIQEVLVSKAARCQTESAFLNAIT